MILICPIAPSGRRVAPHAAARASFRRWRGIPLNTREIEASNAIMMSYGPHYWPWGQMVEQYRQAMIDRYEAERDAENAIRTADWVSAGCPIDF